MPVRRAGGCRAGAGITPDSVISGFEPTIKNHRKEDGDLIYHKGGIYIAELGEKKPGQPTHYRLDMKKYPFLTSSSTALYESP